MAKTQLYYTQYHSGTYAVTDGKVRCCAIDGAWIYATLQPRSWMKGSVPGAL